VLIGATPFEDVITRVHTSYALAAPTEEGDEAWTTAPFIEVVPAGVIPPNPNELLAGNALPQVLAEAKSHADIVLVDSAPLVPVGDAIPIANAVDGVLLVVKLGESRRDELRRALKLLGTLRSKVIGVVITNAERPSDKYDYYATKEPPPPTPAIDPLGPRRRGRRPAPRFEDRAEGNGGGDTDETVAIRSEPDEER
jgi:Mrp family chromosome partitioning ATPase